jgi:hypothetical protein
MTNPATPTGATAGVDLDNETLWDIHGVVKNAGSIDLAHKIADAIARRAEPHVTEQADDEEESAEDSWRRLALQFDGHRMQALGHLRMMLTHPDLHAPVVAEFLKAPPLSGEEVLAQRIAALTQQAAPEAPALYVRLCDIDGTMPGKTVVASKARDAEWNVPAYLASTDQPSAGQVGEIPSYLEAANRVGTSDETALDRFIYDQEPPKPHTDEWRAQLAAVLNQAVRASLTPTAPQAVSQQAELYTCIGKGGEYELLGTAKGAGTMRDVLVCDLTIYRDTTIGQLYHRTPDDFAARMERAPQAATTASASGEAPGYGYILPFKWATDHRDVVSILDADGEVVMEFNTHTQRSLKDTDGLAQERKAAEAFAEFLVQSVNRRAPVQAAQPALPAEWLDRDGRMVGALRDFIEGMSVSMDVSTGDHDAGHRYFGVINEVMDDDHDKNGVTLLVYDARPNFAAPGAAQTTDSGTREL